MADVMNALAIGGKVKCHDGKAQTIRAYREEAHALREFKNLYTDLM
jgi:hypothetical protein